MEESDLLKERLQAITEKHRIQEDIRQKKLELDQEKLKLQHLKKKALREQWLLQDSASHNARDFLRQTTLLSDQQQTRALQLNIHRIEMEVEALEQQESVVSTNESFILNRLKAVEKSPEEIIKEAQENFLREPLQVAMVIPDVPESLFPPANNHTELDTPKKTVFAMEISVTKSLLTGESTILSTATVPPEELDQHDRLKVYEDSRKCVYALNSQQGSHDQTCVSELSANEVEHLLRSATLHRQVNPNGREGHCFYSHPDESDKVEECGFRNQGRHHGNPVLGKGTAETDFSRQREPLDEHCYGHQGNHYSRQEKRHNQSNLREGCHFGNNKGGGFHYLNRPYSFYHVKNCHSAREHGPAVHHSNSFIRSNSGVNGVRPNGCPPPMSHDQEAVSVYQPQICHTPANYIPLSDYISVDEELYCYSPHSYQSTAQYSGPTLSQRVPSPLYGDDTPYTILNTMETTEPITAIFMGFQTAQDDSGRGQEFEGSLTAELVFLEDSKENGEDGSIKEKRSHAQPGVNGGVWHAEGCGDRQTERQVRPGIKRIQKKHKPCCTVC